ncbi:MAG TPA: hypothetical protein V6D20_08095, partial [Candidatus Obscuribacterales bacterium]
YYDGDNSFRDHQTVMGSDMIGTVAGHSQAAGWIQPIPHHWQSALGGAWLMGYASNLPINGRLSQGPSLYAWSGKVGASVETIRWLDYPLANPLGTYGRDPAQEGILAASNPVWNEVSEAYLGFVRGDDYIVIGKTGGLETGIGYKDSRDDGSLMHGYDTYAVDDKSNYYWVYDLKEIVAADYAYSPRPYAYGSLDLFSPGLIVGADYHDGRLYTFSFDRDRIQNRYEDEPVVTVHEFCE